jgi:hypothetical protein
LRGRVAAWTSSRKERLRSPIGAQFDLTPAEEARQFLLHAGDREYAQAWRRTRTPSDHRGTSIGTRLTRLTGGLEPKVTADASRRLLSPAKPRDTVFDERPAALAMLWPSGLAAPWPSSAVLTAGNL